MIHLCLRLIKLESHSGAKSKARAALFVVLPSTRVRLHARLSTKLGNRPVTADKHLLVQITLSRSWRGELPLLQTNIWTSDRSKICWFLDFKNVNPERQEERISDRKGPAEGFGLMQTTAQRSRWGISKDIHRECVSILLVLHIQNLCLGGKCELVVLTACICSELWCCVVWNVLWCVEFMS